ncbi:putative ribosomal protein L7 [Gregarina niphandrodes]|uniref:Ribosomal protein L7 n=1 Tax=Gregarina niphandrodes TaxID=110365 RepID=A0A023B733_GRENI|nr:putative ribosomal protein L7 [Gregarina niphandrodes]EZG66993.1 putative ribosomal protein L7 [Gregarina niphandrodes]|eukprot:XP_011130380.1 putative ribosomal protein L7 [Gregarina niphandrodes]
MLKSGEPSTSKSAVVLRRRKETFIERSTAEDRAKLRKKKVLKPELPKTANAVAMDALQRIRSKRRFSQAAKHKRLPKPLKGSGCVMVIRSSDKLLPCKAVRKELNRLRISKPFKATVLPNTRDNINMLKQLGTFVIYGAISVETLRKLLSTRASLKINKVKESKTEDGEPTTGQDNNASDDTAIVPLSTNILVEENFEEQGFLCIEDLVTEYVNNGPHALDVTNRLEPFQLDRLAKPDHKLITLTYGECVDLDQRVTNIL